MKKLAIKLIALLFGFEGEVIDTRRECISDSTTKSCVEILVEKANGERTWYPCSVHPGYKVEKGDKVEQKPLGKLIKIQGIDRLILTFP